MDPGKRWQAGNLGEAVSFLLLPVPTTEWGLLPQSLHLPSVPQPLCALASGGPDWRGAASSCVSLLWSAGTPFSVGQALSGHAGFGIPAGARGSSCPRCAEQQPALGFGLGCSFLKCVPENPSGLAAVPTKGQCVN